MNVALIANEAMNSRLMVNILGLPKLDIEKALTMLIGIVLFLLCLKWGLGKGGLVGSGGVFSLLAS